MGKHDNVTNCEMLRLDFSLDHGVICTQSYSPNTVLVHFAVATVASQIWNQFEKNSHQNNPGDRDEAAEGIVRRYLRYWLQNRIENEERVYHNFQLLKQSQWQKCENIVLSWAYLVCGWLRHACRQSIAATLGLTLSNGQINWPIATFWLRARILILLHVSIWSISYQNKLNYNVFLNIF